MPSQSNNQHKTCGECYETGDTMVRLCDTHANMADIATQLQDAIAYIRTIGEELSLAGFPSGDRTVILANIRLAIRSLR